MFQYSKRRRCVAIAPDITSASPTAESGASSVSECKTSGTRRPTPPLTSRTPIRRTCSGRKSFAHPRPGRCVYLGEGELEHPIHGEAEPKDHLNDDDDDTQVLIHLCLSELSDVHSLFDHSGRNHRTSPSVGSMCACARSPLVVPHWGERPMTRTLEPCSNRRDRTSRPSTPVSPGNEHSCHDPILHS